MVSDVLYEFLPLSVSFLKLRKLSIFLKRVMLIHDIMYKSQAGFLALYVPLPFRPSISSFSFTVPQEDSKSVHVKNTC